MASTHEPQLVTTAISQSALSSLISPWLTRSKSQMANHNGRFRSGISWNLSEISLFWWIILIPTPYFEKPPSDTSSSLQSHVSFGLDATMTRLGGSCTSRSKAGWPTDDGATGGQNQPVQSSLLLWNSVALSTQKSKRQELDFLSRSYAKNRIINQKPQKQTSQNSIEI